MYPLITLAVINEIGPNSQVLLCMTTNVCRINHMMLVHHLKNIEGGTFSGRSSEWGWNNLYSLITLAVINEISPNSQVLLSLWKVSYSNNCCWQCCSKCSVLKCSQWCWFYCIRSWTDWSKEWIIARLNLVPTQRVLSLRLVSRVIAYTLLQKGEGKDIIRQRYQYY